MQRSSRRAGRVAGRARWIGEDRDGVRRAGRRRGERSDLDTPGLPQTGLRHGGAAQVTLGDGGLLPGGSAGGACSGGGALRGVIRDFCAPPRCKGLGFVTSAPMATLVSRVAAILAVSAAGATTLGSVTACTPKPNGPEPVAEQFFAALATGDTGAAAAFSDKPADARTALNEAWAGLQAVRLDAQIVGSKYAEDTGSVTYRYTWHLPKNRTRTYDGQLQIVREEGRWEVRWSATGLD